MGAGEARKLASSVPPALDAALLGQLRSRSGRGGSRQPRRGRPLPQSYWNAASRLGPTFFFALGWS